MRSIVKSFALLGVVFLFSFTNTQNTRQAYLNALNTKNQLHKPLVVHALVPLCDNQNQGIVPVPKLLGNGLDARNNLYWGALYGVKTHFKRSAKWKLVHTVKNPSSNILERCVFESKNTKGTKVVLIADAYRGDRMKECLEDYFAELSGASITTSLNIATDVDLVVFNGHNGLMDTEVDAVDFKSGSKKKETMAIGCISYNYFTSYWQRLQTYPLVSTTNLMAPEGYVLEGALNSWMEMSSGSQVHVAVANAYNKYQKCGYNGAKRLFKTGWDR